MLEPSSSEEEDDEVVDAPNHVPHGQGGPQTNQGGPRGLDVPNGAPNSHASLSQTGKEGGQAGPGGRGHSDGDGQPYNQSPVTEEKTLTEAELQVCMSMWYLQKGITSCNLQQAVNG